MKKIVFRYFIDFMDGQEQWLNRMANQGYRLAKCGKAWYVFETCQPGEYQYAVDFVADKGNKASRDYRAFIEGLGYRTFYKNINLNFSFGKMKWRPWAKGAGQLATTPGAFNKELLIIEKKNDGTPFEIHSDLQDQLSVYQTVRNACLWNTSIVLGLLIIAFMPGVAKSGSAFWLTAVRVVIAAFVVFLGFLSLRYVRIAQRLKEECETHE